MISGCHYQLQCHYVVWAPRQSVACRKSTDAERNGVCSIRRMTGTAFVLASDGKCFFDEGFDRSQCYFLARYQLQSSLALCCADQTYDFPKASPATRAYYILHMELIVKESTDLSCLTQYCVGLIEMIRVIFYEASALLTNACDAHDYRG